MRPRFLLAAPGIGGDRLQARLIGAGFVRHDLGDLSLWVCPAQALIPFAGELGAAVGTLHDAMDNRACAGLKIGHALAVTGSDGRHLCDRFWGSYAAFWRDRITGAIVIFRDPSSALPVYYRSADGDLLACSDVALARLAGIRLRIAWRSIDAHLRFRQLPRRDTCLEGIAELLGGERLTNSGDGPVVHQLWSPWAHARHARNSRDVSPARLADTIARCVAATAARANRPLLELSGGLDSSIVAHCLAASGVAFEAVTLRTVAADGDEQRYARIAADAAGVALMDLIVRPEDCDLLLSPQRLLPRPGGFAMLHAIDRLLAAHAHDRGADLLMSGTGGDNVFCYIQTATPVLDAARVRGIGQMVKTAFDIARLTHTHVPAVLRAATRRLRAPSPWPASADLLADPADDAAPPFTHPWLALPEHGLAGSRSHIAAILRALPLIDAFDRGTDPGLAFPLLSQPVVEACLAIPSWRWVEGGRDRAHVRSAFTGRLPPALLARRSKGRLESVLASAFTRQRGTLRDLLLDGVLIDEGIVDPNALDRALARPLMGDDAHYVRILEIADAELWARSICTVGADALDPAVA